MKSISMFICGVIVFCGCLFAATSAVSASDTKIITTTFTNSVDVVLKTIAEHPKITSIITTFPLGPQTNVCEVSLIRDDITHDLWTYTNTASTAIWFPLNDVLLQTADKIRVKTGTNVLAVSIINLKF